MLTVHTQADLQTAIYEAAKTGKRIALVPTMGALHAGHASLVKKAKELADFVVMSIFVNPKQFGANEDFDTYPRGLEVDKTKASIAGVDVLYAPAASEIYPENFSLSISVGQVGTILCGKYRPGHFDGVATVVAKLLNQVMPNVAVFGEKDYQQLCIIRKLVDELDMPVEIIGAPTLREADGLALSSRNIYLNEEERKNAAKIYETLRLLAQRIASGQEVAKVIREGESLLKYAGLKLDYLTLADADTLETQEIYAAPARLLVAGYMGNTRLIDNVPIEEARA